MKRIYLALIALALLVGAPSAFVPAMAQTSATTTPQPYNITITGSIPADSSQTSTSASQLVNYLIGALKSFSLNPPLQNLTGTVHTVQYGAFAREGASSPYAMATAGATSEPSPYPTYVGTPGNPASVASYCYSQDASGNSIDSSNPLDRNKLANLYDLGVSWVRQTDAPYFIDEGIFGVGDYNWSSVDAILCNLKQHNVTPAIGFEIGPRQYNDSFGGFTIVTHNRYDNPVTYGQYCSALATHVSTIFGDHLYSVPGNEINGDAGVTDGQGIINGSPPAPVPIPTASPAGSLVVGTSYQYRISAIVNGVPTKPSAEYYSTVAATSGHTSMNITWGPVAAETGGYEVFGRTAGSEQLIGTTAHGVTTFTDTGTVTPSGAMPTSSTVQVTAFEGDVAAYTEDCYQAIKAADPQSFVYGFEINMGAGLSPTPAQFIKDENALGCGVGTCYDGLSVHLYPSYPFPSSSTACLSNDGTGGYGTSCLAEMEAAVGTTVPLMIGETEVTVNSSGGTVTTQAAAVAAATATLQGFSSYPYVRYINWANIDECSEYTSGFFYGGCLVGYPLGASQTKTPMWQSVRSFFQNQ